MSEDCVMLCTLRGTRDFPLYQEGKEKQKLKERLLKSDFKPNLNERYIIWKPWLTLIQVILQDILECK